MYRQITARRHYRGALTRPFSHLTPRNKARRRPRRRASWQRRGADIAETYISATRVDNSRVVSPTHTASSSRTRCQLRRLRREPPHSCEIETRRRQPDMFIDVTSPEQTAGNQVQTRLSALHGPAYAPGTVPNINRPARPRHHDERRPGQSLRGVTTTFNFDITGFERYTTAQRACARPSTA